MRLWITAALMVVGCRTVEPNVAGLSELSAEDEAQLKQFFKYMPDPLELIPGRYGDSMSLSEALLSMPEAERQQVATRLLDRLGFSPDPQEAKMVVFAAKEPKAVSYLLVAHSEQTLWNSFKRAAERFQSSGQTLQPEPWVLPTNLDLNEFDIGQVPLPDREPKQIASNLWQWTPPSDLDDNAVRRRLLMAEVLNRLTDNLALQGYGSPKLPETALFTVTYNGNRITNLVDFLKALRDAGHDVTAYVRVRAANFLALHSKRADGVMRNVAIVTHYVPNNSFGPSGSLLGGLPEAHAELVFDVKPTGPVTGNPMEAAVTHFLGMDGGVRFGPAGISRDLPWSGARTAYHLPADKVEEALRAAGFIRHLFRTVAFEKNLPKYGYGYLGICSDSIGFVELALGFPRSFEPKLFTEERVSETAWRFDSSTTAGVEDRQFFNTFWARRPYGNEIAGRTKRWKKTFMWPKGSEPFLMDETLRSNLECSESPPAEGDPCS